MEFNSWCWLLILLFEILHSWYISLHTYTQFLNVTFIRLMVLRSKHRCRRNLTIELNSGRLSNMINSPCREQYHKWTRVIFDDFEWKLHLLCGCVFSPSEKKSFMIFCKMLDMNWIFPFDYTHFCKNNNHFSSCIIMVAHWLHEGFNILNRKKAIKFKRILF